MGSFLLSGTFSLTIAILGLEMHLDIRLTFPCAALKETAACFNV